MFLIKIFLVYLFGCAGSSLLCGLSSSVSERGSLVAGRSVWASHCCDLLLCTMGSGALRLE